MFVLCDFLYSPLGWYRTLYISLWGTANYNRITCNTAFDICKYYSTSDEIEKVKRTGIPVLFICIQPLSISVISGLTLPAVN